MRHGDIDIDLYTILSNKKGQPISLNRLGNQKNVGLFYVKNRFIDLRTMASERTRFLYLATMDAQAEC